MNSSKDPTSETGNRQEFTHSLGLLKGITSWQMWSSCATILLLLSVVVLLWYPALPAQISFSHGLGGALLVGGCIGLVLAMSGVTLFVQRQRLKTFRKSLIEQMDTATKHRVRAERLYGVSIIDPLTGLYNRRFGEARLQEEIAKAEESGEPLLLLALDFDRFKEINDKHGHAAGDMALKEFSRRLRRAIRACDIPVRVGGDEFLAIFPDCPQDKMQLILSRLDSISFVLDGKKIPVGFSHGLAQYQVSDTPETMTRRADERLYAAKAKRHSPVRA